MPIDPNYLTFANQITQQWDPREFLALQELSQRMQLQNQKIQAQNALRSVLQAPGAIDPQTGEPTPNTLRSMWGIDPNAASAVSQNMLQRQNQQLVIQGNQAKLN